MFCWLMTLYKYFDLAAFCVFSSSTVPVTRSKTTSVTLNVFFPLQTPLSSTSCGVSKRLTSGCMLDFKIVRVCYSDVRSGGESRYNTWNVDFQMRKTHPFLECDHKQCDHIYELRMNLIDHRRSLRPCVATKKMNDQKSGIAKGNRVLESIFHHLGSRHVVELSPSTLPLYIAIFHHARSSAKSPRRSTVRVRHAVDDVGVDIEAIQLTAIRRTLTTIYNPLALSLHLIPHTPLTSTALAPLLTHKAAAQHRQTTSQTASILLLLLYRRRLLVLHLLALRRVVRLLLRGAILHRWALGVLAGGWAVAGWGVRGICGDGEIMWGCVCTFAVGTAVRRRRLGSSLGLTYSLVVFIRG
jgi:hypothetical protein